jgi:hypothetical protein
MHDWVRRLAQMTFCILCSIGVASLLGYDQRACADKFKRLARRNQAQALTPKCRSTDIIFPI